MDARVLQHSIFIFLFWTLLFSDTINAQKPPTTEIRQSKKLTYAAEESIFSSSLSSTPQRDVAPGTIPIFNPTPPTSNANPTIPQPPPYQTVPQPPNPTVPQPPTTTNQPATNNPTPGANMPITQGGSWCIANPTASQTALQVALDYACGYGGADCSAIQQGGACYIPNTFKDHVSYAFNDYYQKKPTPISCVFGGAAQLSSTDPSYGNCHYASSTRTNTATPTLTIPMTPSPPSTTTPTNPYTPTPTLTIPMTPSPPSTTTPTNPYTPGGNTPTPTLTIPMTPSPPSTATPTNPYTPGGPTSYGTEPTGMPNSANIAFPMLTISALLLVVASNSI